MKAIKSALLALAIAQLVDGAPSHRGDDLSRPPEALREQSPQDVDECQSNPCVHGTCTDGVNSYTCQCSPGYRGDNCTEACQDLNEDCGLYTANGLCNYNSNGMDWEQYMNENCAKSCGICTESKCQPNPCVHGTCTDGVNSYTCQCSPGYRGDNCDKACQDLDEHCGTWTDYELCNYDMEWEQYMNENCAKSCGICTAMADQLTEEQIAKFKEEFSRFDKDEEKEDEEKEDEEKEDEEKEDEK